jgi:RHS repeat-associated protein
MNKRAPWRYLITTMLLIVSLLGSMTAQALETITYLHTDFAGTPLAATDPNGNLLWKENYRPYGEQLYHDDGGTNNLWFTGKPYDADTGLSYFGARYYDSAIGRFMGVDPQDFSESNLHSFNRYAYGNNNPYKFVDPDGQFAVPLLALFGAFVVIHELVSTPTPVPGHPDAIESTIAPWDVAGALGGGLRAAGSLRTTGSSASVVEISGQAVVRGRGVTNPEIPKLSSPSIPNGVTQSQFGKEVVGWGRGAEEALNRLKNVTGADVAKMQQQGLTRKMAQEWRNFYANEFARNANNATARNRVDLMEKVIKHME